MHRAFSLKSWLWQLGLAPFDHLLRNTRKGHQLESKRSSLLLQTNELAVVGSSFPNREDALIIRLPRRDDGVENPGELVSGRRNGRRSTEPGSPAAEVVPQVRRAAVKRRRRPAESHGQAMNPDFSPRVWKGGALAPPLQGLSDYSRVPRPAQLAAASCAGRGTNRGREPRFRRG